MGVVFDEIVGTVESPESGRAQEGARDREEATPEDPDRWRREARFVERRATRLRAD